MMRPLCRQRLLLMTVLTAVGSLPANARPPALRWVKIHVSHALPSVVFLRLGLTHSTKNGLTRDGKRGVPDPTFPPGLTDVVPSDLDHLLLVRGTPGGVTLFRSRVAAADVSVPLLHLHVELTSPQSPDAAPIVLDQDGLNDGIPAEVSLGSGDSVRTYQLKTRANPDGTYWIACRVSLPLPTPTTNPASDASAPAAVFTPERVWTDPVSRKTRLRAAVVFEDRAADRQAAGRKLGATGADTGGDYLLRVTLTPQGPPNVPPAIPTQTVPSQTPPLPEVQPSPDVQP